MILPIQAMVESGQHPRQNLIMDMLSLMQEGCDFHMSLSEYLACGSDSAERLKKDPGCAMLYQTIGHLSKTALYQTKVREAVREALPDGLLDKPLKEVAPGDWPLVMQYLQTWHEDHTWLKDAVDLKCHSFAEGMRGHVQKLKELTAPYFDEDSRWHLTLPEDASFDTVLQTGRGCVMCAELFSPACLMWWL